MSIRKRGKQAYQVRVHPFPARTVPTRQAAEHLELDLKKQRSMGERYVEKATTLGDEIDAFLSRLRASGGRSPRTIEYYERCAKVWDPFRSKPVPGLRRSAVEDFIVARAVERPRSAKNELEFLKRVLSEAKGRGQRVDQTVGCDPRDQPPTSPWACAVCPRVVRLRVVVS